MIWDKRLLFTINTTTDVLEQTVCDAGATEASTEYINGQSITKRSGSSEKLSLMMIVTEDFATCTTLTLTLQHDSASGFSTTLKTAMVTEDIPVGELVAGAMWKWPLPDITYQQYVRVNFARGTSNATAGKVVVGIVMD